MTDDHTARLEKIHDAVGGTVTRLKPTARDPGRVSILVDRHVIATLPRPTLADLPIAVGDPWTQKLATLVADAVDADKARRRAIHMLGRRAYSSGDLAHRLREKGHRDAAIATTLDQFRARGWLDDLTYARDLAAAEARRASAGPRRVQHKLYLKKVPPEIITQVLAEITDTRDLIADARSVAEKKLKSLAMRRADPATRKRRLWSLLARRGFTGQTIHSALDQLPNLTDPSQ